MCLCCVAFCTNVADLHVCPGVKLTVGSLEDLRKAYKGAQDPDPDSELPARVALVLCMFAVYVWCPASSTLCLAPCIFPTLLAAQPAVVEKPMCTCACCPAKGFTWHLSP